MKQQLRHLVGQRAIVIGGSMAGLVAARAAADHFREVTVIERDSLPASADQRRGVPQGHHAHGILASGRRVLEQFFPGISAHLIESGALSCDLARDVRWFIEGACLNRSVGGLDGLFVSRPLLELAVRNRVRQLPNVRFVEDCAVDKLVSTPDRQRVAGVKAGGKLLPADLVIDAAGRGSRSVQWLEELGYRRPHEDRIEIGLDYTTRWFRRTPDHLNGDMAAITPPTPAGKRGGVMLAQEGDRWIVTLVSHFGKLAPAEVGGFIEFARTLPAPHIHEVVRSAEPLGDATTARFPASVWRRYDKLGRFPEGYLVFGDAISSFNPRYGQGMSVAALQAVELQRTLMDAPDRLASRFFARAAKVIEIPWTIAATNDLRIPEAEGPRTVRSSVMNWYMARLLKAAHRDAHVALTFHQVANLMAAPTSILAPGIALRVLRSNLPGAGWMTGWRLQTRDAR